MIQYYEVKYVLLYYQSNDLLYIYDNHTYALSNKENVYLLTCLSFRLILFVDYAKKYNWDFVVLTLNILKYHLLCLNLS